MTIDEIIKAALDYAKTLDCEDIEIAIRYDNKKVSVGELLPCSKSNFDRDDSREFPDYDTEEYKELDTMPGTSAYSAFNPAYDDLDDLDTWAIRSLRQVISAKSDTLFEHCSIVTGEQVNWSCEDLGEICLDDCRVVKVLW